MLPAPGSKLAMHEQPCTLAVAACETDAVGHGTQDAPSALLSKRLTSHATQLRVETRRGSL